MVVRSQYCLGTLIAVGVWESIPLATIIFMAGLKTVPEEVIEAAKIDGANAINRLFLVIIPMMKPVLAAVIILLTIDSVKQFDIAFSLTDGGPGTSTLTMTFYSYNIGFGILQIGRAAASSLLIFMALVSCVVLLSAGILRERKGTSE